MRDWTVEHFPVLVQCVGVGEEEAVRDAAEVDQARVGATLGSAALLRRGHRRVDKLCKEDGMLALVYDRKPFGRYFGRYFGRHTG